MLYGRSAQCDVLERLLADARRLRSGALVVRGEARMLLLVAAAETTGDPAVVLRAGDRLGVGGGALEQAEAAGLVGRPRAGWPSGTRWSGRPPT